jgi:hypothetical protein
MGERYSHRLVEKHLLHLMQDDKVEYSNRLLRFSFIWRLYEFNAKSTSLLFSRVILMVLDGLLSRNPRIVIASETWIRLNITSMDR